LSLARATFIIIIPLQSFPHLGLAVAHEETKEEKWAKEDAKPPRSDLEAILRR